MRAIAIAFLLSVPVVFSGAQGSFASETEAQFRGAPCPRVTLTTADGGRIELPAKAEHGLTIVTFLTSSCVPCRAEAPVLDRYFQKYKARGLRILGIDAEDPSDVLKALVGALKVSYPIVANSGGAVNAFRAYAYPTNVLIGGDGKIAIYSVGSHAEITRYVDAYYAKH